MAPRNVSLVLFSICIAIVSLAPGAATAGVFNQAWSVSGWEFRESLGRLHADLQPGLLFSNKLDGRFAIFDGPTGALRQEFPDYAYGSASYQAWDVTGDGSPELMFSRVSSPPKSEIFTWNGSSYVPLFPALSDTVVDWRPIHARSATAFDILEITDNDVRLRDLTGALLFRAATAIPGWTGSSTPLSPALDLEFDGIEELVVSEYPNSAHLIRHSGATFNRLWSLNGWALLNDIGRPGDTQPRLIMFNDATDRLGVFDALTGVMARDLGQVGLTQAFTQDLTGDTQPELVLWRSELPPLFQAIHWNGAGYDVLFTVTDEIEQLALAHMRGPSQVEFLELAIGTSTPRDFRIRDANGTVLFSAAAAIPGWIGSIATTINATLDLDHNGLDEVLLRDDTTPRFIKYAGGFTQGWAMPANSLIVTELGRVTGSATDELMEADEVTGSFTVRNGATGAVVRTFTDVNWLDNGGFESRDFDGDGLNELVFFAFNTAGTPPPLTKYKWNGSGFQSVFSIPDTLATATFMQLRDNRHHEVLSLSPSNKMLLRDLADGSVLFSSATDVVGWTGQDAAFNTVDFDLNGMQDLVVIDNAQTRFFRFGGSVAVEPSAAPLTFQILPSQPNPSRAGTALRFVLPKAGAVGVRIFDTAGRLVRRLDQTLPAGRNEILWDGYDESGRLAPIGVLFYQVTAGGAKQTSRLVRLR